MAMTLASPSASPSPAAEHPKSKPSSNDANAAASGNDDNASSNTTANGNNNNNNVKSEQQQQTTTTTTPANGAANGSTPGGVKRKPSRRANTAERRATHNAVERQRRETLNGRFLDLAALLPNLSQIRRPSKSSIVNSSIAHIHASRRHRLLASRELRLLKTESDALRRELNEWRDRAGLPRVEEPPRSEAFGIVVSGELDVLVAEMGAEMAAQGLGNIGGGGSGMMDVEEDEELDDWSGPASAYPNGGGQYDDDVPGPFSAMAQAAQGGMIIPQQQAQHVGHHHHHHPHHPQQPHHGHHHPHPQQFASQQQQQQAGFGYPGSGFDDERPFKGSPFAHNVPRGPYDGPTPAPPSSTALFTPPATRDGLPPNGVAGLNVSVSTSSNGSSHHSTGAASPTHSVHSVHSVPSPGAGPMHGLPGGGSPPPLSAVSTQFSASNARSASGSPPLSSNYELTNGNGNNNNNNGERRGYGGPRSGMSVDLGGMGMGGFEYGHGMHHGMGGHHHVGGHHGGHPGHHVGVAGGHGHHGGHHAGHHGGVGGHHAGHGGMVTAAAGGGGGLFGMML